MVGYLNLPMTVPTGHDQTSHLQSCSSASWNGSSSSSSGVISSAVTSWSSVVGSHSLSDVRITCGNVSMSSGVGFRIFMYGSPALIDSGIRIPIYRLDPLLSHHEASCDLSLNVVTKALDLDGGVYSTTLVDECVLVHQSNHFSMIGVDDSGASSDLEVLDLVVL